MKRAIILILILDLDPGFLLGFGQKGRLTNKKGKDVFMF
jgi:hypothetical protein